MLVYIIGSLLVSQISSFSTNWVEEFDYYTYLDENELFRIYWNNLDNDIIEFGMEASATGWIALGISPNGQMPGSDVAIGWVDDDGAYLQDRYTEGRATPLYESHQNLTLIDGEEVDGMTRIRFTRPKYTCNQNDIQVSDGTTRIIWAFHESDDPSEECFDSNSISMHTNKGSQSLNLNSGIQTPITLEDDIKYIDILMDEVSVPSDTDTTYYCKIFKVPELDDTHHVVKFEPIVQEGNEGAVHHYIVYECDETIIEDSDVGVEGVCDTDFENMPAKECRGSTTLYGWAIGGGSLWMPEDVGFPIGGDSGPKYLMFEVHYDNPDLRDDIVDSSGFRMTITPTLRTYNAGYMSVGTMINALGTFIPPGLSYAHNLAFMHGECTQNILPEDGVKILTSNLHAHTLGVALSFRQIRDGIELEPIESNWNYDFNYQNWIFHEDERRILPGDTLIMDCYYDSSSRDFTTYGGESTQEEMCIGSVMYYPAVDFVGGFTWKTETALENWLKDAQNAGYLEGNITEAFSSWDADILEYQSEVDGAEEFYSRLWDPAYTNYDQHYAWCGGRNFSDPSNFIWKENATQPIDFEEYDLNIFTCDDYDNDNTDIAHVCIADGPDIIPTTTDNHASIIGNICFAILMGFVGTVFV